MPETNAIFANIKTIDYKNKIPSTKRLSLDCKATVKLGEFCRNGVTRGENQALDHDFGGDEKYIAFGIVDEDTNQLHLSFGSSYKTSDFIVDCLEDWWNRLTIEEQKGIELVQLKVDNGPESSGVRTQFLNRMVKFVDRIRKPIQLLYYPPYHSKYNPIERCWGVLEKHWNGTLLRDLNTMLSWAKSMIWKGVRPIVQLNQKVYAKGIGLSKKAMKEIEKRLQRNAALPKWDILIQPLSG